MNDHQFLAWIWDRLATIHHENTGYDYMIRLKNMADDAKANESKPREREPAPYLLDYRMTIEHLATILSILKHEGRVTITLGTPGPSKCDPIADWHQIELAVIAAHERRVRG